MVIAHGHPELSIGGGEVAAYELFRGLRRLPGVSAWFIAADDPTQPPTPALSSFFAGRRDEIILHSRTVDPFLFSQRSSNAIDHFSSLVARIRPDIVHFHHYMNLGLELVAAVRRVVPDARIIMTLHEYLGICANFGQMVKTETGALCYRSGVKDCMECFPNLTNGHFLERERFTKSHFSFIDTFVAPSEFLRSRYVSWGLPAERIIVLDNATPAAVASPRPLRRDERRSVFGFFGQINPYKGLDVLLRAFETLGRLPKSEVSDIRLNVHGAYLDLNPPEYIATIRDLFSRTTPFTRFSGSYRREELSALMTAVDWVVVPSLWWENAPVIIEEALAHRRPVICSDIGGMAEKIRPGKDGFHFPVGDVTALADLLVRLAAQVTVWDGLQHTMRLPITPEQSVDRHLQLYRALSAGSATGTAAPSRSSNRDFSPVVARNSIGSARIINLPAGIYALDVSFDATAAQGPVASHSPVLHICSSPPCGDRVVISVLRTQNEREAWLGLEGGTVIVTSYENKCSLIATLYGMTDAGFGTVNIIIRRLGGAPMSVMSTGASSEPASHI